MSVEATKWSDGKFRANKNETLHKACSSIVGISDREGQGIKYWSWIYTRADCFYGQYNIYWYAKISLVLHGERVKITSQELERDFSQNTRAYTITQSFSFFSFLEVIRSLGNVWQTYELLKNEHHSEVTFLGCTVQFFFIFTQFLTRQNLNINSVLNYLCIQRPISYILLSFFFLKIEIYVLEVDKWLD